MMTGLQMTPIRVRILRFLRDHPSDIATLRLALRICGADALRHVETFQAHGLTTRRDGTWHLTPAGRTYIERHDQIRAAGSAA